MRWSQGGGRHDGSCRVCDRRQHGRRPHRCPRRIKVPTWGEVRLQKTSSSSIKVNPGLCASGNQEAISLESLGPAGRVMSAPRAATGYDSDQVWKYYQRKSYRISGMFGGGRTTTAKPGYAGNMMAAHGGALAEKNLSDLALTAVGDLDTDVNFALSASCSYGGERSGCRRHRHHSPQRARSRRGRAPPSEPRPEPAAQVWLWIASPPR